ncbi:MAG: hypothetical protein LBC74_11475 [Planctomycetaceae bacterium]|nr:hypothetical protein [Planctomycetaceae bacterium]
MVSYRLAKRFNLNSCDFNEYAYDSNLIIFSTIVYFSLRMKRAICIIL